MHAQGDGTRSRNCAEWRTDHYEHAAATALAAAPIAAVAGDTPAGFYYGNDTNGPGPVGSGVEFTENTCGGAYGSYTGRTNTGTDPDDHRAWSNDANLNAYETFGFGSQNYFDLGGPGNIGATTAAQAMSYGETQGNTAMAALRSFYNTSGTDLPLDFIVLYADIESGNGGWNGNTALGRDVFNGFFDVTSGVRITVQGVSEPVYTGVYSTADFANGQLSGTIPHTFEWTAQKSHGTITSAECASNWNSNGFSAVFFLGDTTSSACAVQYQYVVGGADWDQVDVNRINAGITNGTCA